MVCIFSDRPIHRLAAQAELEMSEIPGEESRTLGGHVGPAFRLLQPRRPTTSRPVAGSEAGEGKSSGVNLWKFAGMEQPITKSTTLARWNIAVPTTLVLKASCPLATLGWPGRF